MVDAEERGVCCREAVYNSIDELWNATTIAADNANKDSINVLTSSLDSRI